jgi:hypothetical protein
MAWEIDALPTEDFNRITLLAEKATHDNHIAADAAFTAAMNLAIRRGREKVRPGTFVDETPPIGARRYSGDSPRSMCGSPAAACDATGSPRGIHWK